MCVTRLNLDGSRRLYVPHTGIQRCFHYKVLYERPHHFDYRLQISTLVMNVDSYNKLPADLQAVIDKAAAETMEYMRGQSDYLVQYCIDQSPTVEFLGPPDDLAEWQSKAKSIWPEFYELIGDGDAAAGKAVVEAVTEAAK